MYLFFPFISVFFHRALICSCRWWNRQDDLSPVVLLQLYFPLLSVLVLKTDLNFVILESVTQKENNLPANGTKWLNREKFLVVFLRTFFLEPTISYLFIFLGIQYHADTITFLWFWYYQHWTTFPSTFEKTETFCSHFIVVGNGIFQWNLIQLKKNIWQAATPWKVKKHIIEK